MKKPVAATILILLIAFGLSACGATAATTATTAAGTSTKAAGTTANATSAADSKSLTAEENAELTGTYAAKYSKITSSYKVDESTVGTVLAAAEGTADNGAKVVAMKVRSARSFNHSGYTTTGWDEAEPGAYTMAIVVDKATSKVVAWKVLADGTRKKEYFVVPDSKIDAYKSVPITTANVFDSFKDGLVLELNVPTSKSSDGSTIITGTSIVYTGTSEDGTLSGQLVRHCFRTAAHYYTNYAKG